MERPAAQVEVLGDHSAPLHADARHAVVVTPGPGVAEPQGREHVDLCGFRSGVADRDPDEDVLRVGFRVVGRDLPIPVAIEDPGVEKLVLGVMPRPAGVRLDELRVGKLRLRVHVAPAHPRVSRRRVEVEPVLLDVLAMVSLLAGEAEQPLLEDGVLAVPECEGEAEPLPVVADPGQAVLVPAIRARPRVFVRKEVPRVTVRAVVLPHGAPCPLAQIGSPAPPRRPTPRDLEQASGFG